MVTSVSDKPGREHIHQPLYKAECLDVVTSSEHWCLHDNQNGEAGGMQLGMLPRCGICPQCTRLMELVSVLFLFCFVWFLWVELAG